MPYGPSDFRVRLQGALEVRWETQEQFYARYPDADPSSPSYLPSDRVIALTFEERKQSPGAS